MRDEISKLGVGQAAVNMAFQTTADFSETFMLGKIDGEEPMQEFFLDMEHVMSREELTMEGAQKTTSFEKDELKKKLRGYGLGEEQSDEIVSLFTKKGRRMEISSFVVLLSRYGIARNNISNFLKELGLEDNSVVSILGKADELEAELDDRDIADYIMASEDVQQKQ
jgi:hypothetical protein